MSDRPLSFDPERLRRERTEADLGANAETEHGHADHAESSGERALDAAHEPTSGATPPAR